MILERKIRESGLSRLKRPPMAQAGTSSALLCITNGTNGIRQEKICRKHMSSIGTFALCVLNLLWQVLASCSVSVCSGGKLMKL